MRFKPVLLATVLVAWGHTGCENPELPKASHFDPAKIVVIAHRGAAGVAPENTLVAIREALRRDADAIEVDLHQTRDGVVVAIHDDTVDRTTDGEGKVGESTVAQLKKLDAGAWFDPKFAGERIPTLTEVLDAVPDDTILILEVKEGGDTYPDIEKNIVDALRRSGRQNVVLKSFSIEVLAAFERMAPKITRLYVFNAHVAFLNLILDDGLRFGNAFDQNVAWLQKHSTFITEKFVRRAQRRGFRVVAWNVHDNETMREMICLGVDAIETDYPAVLKTLLAKTSKNNSCGTA